VQALERRSACRCPAQARALLLTDVREMLLHDETMLDQLASLRARSVAAAFPTALSVTTIVSFASLWLIRRLAEIPRIQSVWDVRISADNQLVDLTRIASTSAIATAPRRGAERRDQLFGEEVMPVCSPALLRDKKRR